MRNRRGGSYEPEPSYSAFSVKATNPDTVYERDISGGWWRVTGWDRRRKRVGAIQFVPKYILVKAYKAGRLTAKELSDAGVTPPPKGIPRLFEKWKKDPDMLVGIGRPDGSSELIPCRVLRIIAVLQPLEAQFSQGVFGNPRLETQPLETPLANVMALDQSKLKQYENKG
jgi:hypothetical protein